MISYFLLVVVAARVSSVLCACVVVRAGAGLVPGPGFKASPASAGTRGVQGGHEGMCLCQTILWRMIQTDSDQALIDHCKENHTHMMYRLLLSNRGHGVDCLQCLLMSQ